MTYYSSPAWIKRLTKLMATVSLESLRVCARSGRFDNSSLEAFAGAGDALLSLTLIADSSHGKDLDEGMSALGAAVPRYGVNNQPALKRGEDTAYSLGLLRCIPGVFPVV